MTWISPNGPSTTTGYSRTTANVSMIIFTILYFILSPMFFFTPINMNSPTAGHLDTSYKLSEHVGYVVWSMGVGVAAIYGHLVSCRWTDKRLYPKHIFVAQTGCC